MELAWLMRCGGGVLLLCVLLNVSTTQAGEIEDVVRCGYISDANERLGCFDRTVAGLEVMPAPADTVVDRAGSAPLRQARREVFVDRPARTQVAARPAAPVEPRLSGEQRFGLPVVLAPDELERLEARVATADLDGFKNYIVTLDNGQVWRQIQQSTQRIKPGDQVTIIPNKWGSSFLLRLKNGRNSVVVERVDKPAPGPVRVQTEVLSEAARQPESAALPSSADTYGLPDESSGDVEFRVRIAKAERNGFDRYVITLENGQIWRQLEASRIRVAAGDNAMIRPNPWGNTFLLRPDGALSSLSVERVDRPAEPQRRAARADAINSPAAGPRREAAQSTSRTDDQRSEMPDENSGTLEGVVVKAERNGFDRYVITLDNGQIWRQIESSSQRIKKGDKVEIRPNRWGNTFLMKPENARSSLSVERIDRRPPA